MNENLATAAKLAPVLERVHGKNHPELTRVRELTEQLSASSDQAATANLFAQLREVTGEYAVPSDGCEAYVATYEALQAADAAQAQVHG